MDEDYDGGLPFDGCGMDYSGEGIAIGGGGDCPEHGPYVEDTCDKE